ncbi:FtsX-like permease family protein [Streptomyces sp. YS415]|uniref:FtsX-like permease family protein n=1 Tax=Streptomyces sp. YS415 TaxID=2944806 RepID=UPI00202161EC|nr:ABC transporter permease [Streptomyces sp. YS415]MCL7429376.1 hypothetical protein [Streptomyces sp. YS415]
MRPLTVVRLALAGGRTDQIRTALTALGAALATLTLLAAATVFAVTGQHAAGYTNDLLVEEGLRPGVAFGILLLSVPVLAYVAQCGRLGAPDRERRLAAMRMAGATPRQVVRIAAAETTLASVAGTLAGLGAYFLGRVLLDAPGPDGRRPLPTDVLPHPVAFVLVAAGVPFFVTALTTLALRRVTLTPLGVVRRVRTGRPGPIPGVLVLTGLGLCALVEPAHRYFTHRPRTDDLPTLVMGALIVTGVLAVSVGVVWGTGWISHTAGRLLHRFAQRPATLLAGRRLMADPWSGSRTFSAMMVALIAGAAAAGLSALTVATERADEENLRRYSQLLGEPYVPAGTEFYERAYELVGYAVIGATAIAAMGLLVAFADGVTARRRTLASLVACGTPRTVLSKALGWQILTPVVPTVLLAVAVGILLPRLAVPGANDTQPLEALRCTPLPGDPASACQDAAYAQAHSSLHTAERVQAVVEVPWGQLGLLAGGAVTATVVITLVSLVFLRMSTRAWELRVQ